MTSPIQVQIRSCRKLLDMFRKDREEYASRNSIAISEVLESMKKKQRLMDVFAKGEKLMQSPSDKPEVRDELRELKDLLEQLLVIEQENELLLTNLIRNSTDAKNDGNSKSSSTRSQMRPALQRRQPFVPQPQNRDNSKKKRHVKRTSSLKRSGKYL